MLCKTLLTKFARKFNVKRSRHTLAAKQNRDPERRWVAAASGVPRRVANS